MERSLGEGFKGSVEQGRAVGHVDGEKEEEEGSAGRHDEAWVGREVGTGGGRGGVKVRGRVMRSEERRVGKECV